jgi:O-antigen ligase
LSFGTEWGSGERWERLGASAEAIVRPSGDSSFLIFLGVLAALAGLLLSQFLSPTYVFGAMAIVVCLLSVLTRWPYGALLAVAVTSVMSRIKIAIGGWNARPEHFAVALLIVVFGFRWIVGKRVHIAWTTADYLVAAYVAWNYVSSALMSPDPRLTLRWALLNNLMVLPYFLIRILVVDERVLRRFFRALLVIGIAESTYALLAFASHQLLRSSFGVEVDQYAAGVGGVYGTQFEPNILGSYCGSLAIMLLVLYFLSQRRPRWVLAGAILALAALLVSLARAAVIGFGFVLFILLILGVWRGLVRVRRLLPLWMCVALLLAPIVLTSGKNLAGRFSNWSGAGVQGDADTMGRIIEVAAALEDISQHPLIGNGTASFQLLADAKNLPILGDRPWVANSPIRILHDTGMVGLVLFGLMALAIIKQIKNSFSYKVTGKNIIIALFAGCMVYAIAFMATDGTMLSFFWVQVGLLVAACAVIGGDSRVSVRAGA